jgi:hypothetical protein
MTKTIRKYGKCKTGIFSPSNPHKYKGKSNEIIYRSMLEKRVMRFLDQHPNVLEWSSEEFFIQYLCETDNKIHKYFPDFYVKFIDKDKNIRKQIIEVKPYIQTLPPQSKKKTKRFVNDCLAYIKNVSKWKSAKRFCEKMNMDFVILTEKEIEKRM